MEQYAMWYKVLIVLVVGVGVVGIVQYLMNNNGHEKLKGTITLFSVMFTALILATFAGDIDVKKQSDENIENVDKQKQDVVVAEEEEEEGENQFLDEEGEGVTVYRTSLGYGVSELKDKVKNSVEENGLKKVGEFNEEEYEIDSYYVRYEDSEDESVRISTYLTKEGKEVSRIVIESIDWEDIDEEKVKETIEAYVKAIDVDTPDAYRGYFLGSLLSVKNGESIEVERNGVVYASAKSENTGLMFFIDSTERVNG